MDKSLNVAVVGAGYWGKNLVRNFSGAKRCDLRYICDLDEKILAAQKKNYPDITVTADLEALPGVRFVESVLTPDGRGYRIRGTHGADLRPIAYELAREKGWPLRELRRDVKTLEVVFNELATGDIGATQEKLTEGGEWR